MESNLGQISVLGIIKASPTISILLIILWTAQEKKIMNVEESTHLTKKWTIKTKNIPVKLEVLKNNILTKYCEKITKTKQRGLRCNKSTHPYHPAKAGIHGLIHVHNISTNASQSYQNE